MDRNLFIDGEKIEVPERIYIIHTLGQFKQLKSVYEYNKFVDDYKMDRKFFDTFYKLVTGNDFKRSGYYMYERVIERSLDSLDALIWCSKYFELTSTVISMEKLGSSYFDLMYDKYINYPDNSFSKEFREYRTLLSFYHSLIDSLETEYMSCNYLIPVKVINERLSMYSSITEKDIEKDLNNHGIINKINNEYYKWINKSVLRWYKKTSCLRLFELTQYKLLKDF